MQLNPRCDPELFFMSKQINQLDKTYRMVISLGWSTHIHFSFEFTLPTKTVDAFKDRT